MYFVSCTYTQRTKSSYFRAPNALRTRETGRHTAVLMLANDGPSKISRDFSEGPLFSLSPIENSCSRQLRSP